MPGVGWSKPKPYHWRVIFRPWLDLWRRLTGGNTVKDWHEWAMRQAVGSGLSREVSDFFWSHISAGAHPSIAAHWALEEWDI